MAASSKVAHPLTGEPSSYQKIADDLGMSRNTVSRMYRQKGGVARLMELYSVPKNKRQCYARLKKRGITLDVHAKEIRQIQQTPAGRLSTCLFRDYRQVNR